MDDILSQRVSGGAVGVLQLVNTEKGAKKVIGQPRYGVHAMDVKENLQLVDLLVRELKYLSDIRVNQQQYEANDSLLHDAAKYAMNSDELVSKLQSLSVNSTVCNEIKKGWKGDVVIKNVVEGLSDYSKNEIKKSVATHYTKRSNKTKEIKKRDNKERNKGAENSLVNALSQSEFIETTESILKNTMFNLIQEAVFGEYAITEDPLLFATLIQE